jgi:hypothetical protein
MRFVDVKLLVKNGAKCRSLANGKQGAVAHWQPGNVTFFRKKVTDGLGVAAKSNIAKLFLVGNVTLG